MHHFCKIEIKPNPENPPPPPAPKRMCTVHNNQGVNLKNVDVHCTK